MRALLDVNVLIALFDTNHIFYDKAHEWLTSNAKQGIATCPITENGFIRILSHTNYSSKFQLTPTEVINRLKSFIAYHDHAFWADSLSLCDEAHYNIKHLIGSKQVTDSYLLGLAIAYGGKLVTLDKNLVRLTVRNFSDQHLTIIQ